MGTFNYERQCKKKTQQSLPSLWELAELWGQPKQLILCSKYKMLIHAAGKLELSERAALLPLPPSTPSLVNSLSLQQLTAYTPIMGASPFWHNSSLLSGCHTTLDPALSLWTVPGTMNHNPSSPRSLRPRKASSFTASCRGRRRPCVRGYACQKSLTSTGNVSSLGRARKKKFTFWNFVMWA